MATSPDPEPAGDVEPVRPRHVSSPSQEAWTTVLSDELDEQAQALADGYPVHEEALHVDWWTLYEYSTEIAWGVVEYPAKALGATHKTMTGTAQRALEDSYSAVLSDCPIRVSNLPPELNLRVGDLRTEMLGTLVDVEGEVVHVEAVEPWVKEAAYECRMCGAEMRTPQSYGDLWEPPECESCEAKQNGIWQLNQDRSRLVDYQFAVLAPLESSLDDPPTINIILKHDLVGRIEQGDEIVATGVYRTSPMDLQKETQLNVFLEGVALDVDERVEADKVKASELDQYIRDIVENPSEYDVDEDGNFGVDVDDIVAVVHEQQGIRKEEVRARIDDGFLDENPDISQGANRLFPDG